MSTPSGKLFQLTLFYPNLKQHQSTVQRIRDDVKAIAGANWRVLSAGEQVCAIGFVSDATHAQLQARLSRYSDEYFLFLLVEVSAVVSGYMSKDIFQWLNSRLVRSQLPPGTI